ncbi:MAG: glycerol-3-phosphate 1-O-acyltransferase PlsY [Candidatus Omnitrophica bacterium]|nr:glycerol-3-phosphate 1-O-acyltransferase PlsY [Candidatus Omnitrophota bacterium]MDD5429194.1 glycerol-3-phosphate 1-O-acyltransferase PlsY [Candidatus Omnitrophota bacterium]
MEKLITLILSFISGSMPFGFLVAYAVRKIDIRKFGSGNIGATNVYRVVGKSWGVTVFILDFLKGFFPVLIAKNFVSSSDSFLILVAVLAVCGHNWTPFLRFKGGKGVTTSLGALSGLGFVFPGLGWGLITAIGIWLVVFLIFRFVSLASITASLGFLVLALIFVNSVSIKIVSFLLCVFIVFQHRKNIKRLLNKTENKV